MSKSVTSTIYALASAPGRAGVAVFRLSGPAGLAALRFLGVEKVLEPRLATLVTLKAPIFAPRNKPEAHLSGADVRSAGAQNRSVAALHEDSSTITTTQMPVEMGCIIDHALAVYFPAPHSFTGEDVVELHTHGSRAVMRLLLEALGAMPGLRMAEAGEFARRAFMHGKLDLAQVEGLADVIDAETTSQHRQAMRQLGGVTTRRVEALRMAILEPLALMEAYIDFPDEEIPESVLAEATQRVEALTMEVANLLDDGGIGEKIREGLDIVILGAPNAGKSSLLNAFAKREAAIVSAEAGTTRDVIEVPMEMGGYAVTLVDTAGLREAEGSIEAEGIRRARHRAQHADITLLLCDITEIAQRASELNSQRSATTLIVATKSDLGPLPALPFAAQAISTQTGVGIAELIAVLGEMIASRMESVASPLITRARHREALMEALSSLKQFRADAPLELVCEELRHAAAAIGKITGKIWVDDVLDLVFSRFCIGK